MRLVVTGALGHIGSHLIRRLRPGDADEVILVDDLSSRKHASLFDLPDAVPCRFVEADVRTAVLDALLDDDTVVVHLAAITDSVGAPIDEIDGINFGGTVRVADACTRAGSKLLFLSSTSVYGAVDGTIDEEGPFTGTPNPYVASKIHAERWLQARRAEAGLRYFVGRCGTIYNTSVGMSFHTAINRFCWQASTGQPLGVWRTAMDQARPYLDVDDAVQAIRFVIQRDLFEGAACNLLTQNATVREVVDAIREVVPDVEVELVDSPIMNTLSLSVSAERFRRLGFEFRGDLRSGIRRTLRLLEGLRQARALHGQR